MDLLFEEDTMLLELQVYGETDDEVLLQDNERPFVLSSLVGKDVTPHKSQEKEDDAGDIARQKKDRKVLIRNKKFNNNFGTRSGSGWSPTTYCAFEYVSPRT